MIEDRSYGKAELAMLYFPTATPRVALNRLVRWINRCPELKQSLCSGYAGKFSHFYTRQQVAEIIIEFLGEFNKTTITAIKLLILRSFQKKDCAIVT